MMIMAISLMGLVIKMNSNNLNGMSKNKMMMVTMISSTEQKLIIIKNPNNLLKPNQILV